MKRDSNYNASDGSADINATAAAWLSRRDGGMNPSQTEEMLAWLEEDPRHEAAFAELEEVWGTFDELRAALL